jgi:glyoxylase-like metal-dependent hydrolase (beta-lactamase superfamily II)
MRILRLHPGIPSDYCCNVYWVTGDSNRPGDWNTLVDVGSEHSGNLPYFLNVMEQIPKGIGRHAIEQVVITHGHYDHVGGLSEIVKHFRPSVWAHYQDPLVTRVLQDGEWLRIGDKDFKVMHTPGHSEDSICLFCPETRDLFSGDTLYRISDTEGAYPVCYLKSLERILELGVRTIHPGHGESITQGADAFIKAALDRVRASRTDG